MGWIDIILYKAKVAESILCNLEKVPERDKDRKFSSSVWLNFTCKEKYGKNKLPEYPCWYGLI